MVGVADHEGGQSGEQRHRDQDPLRADVADRLHDVGKAADRNPPGRGVLGAGGGPEQPEQHRQIEQRVEYDAVGGAERQHDDAADGRTDQDAQITRRRVQPHRARQIGRADDVVEQQLVRRLPQHAGAAMDDEQQHRVPHLKRVGDEEDAPSRRCHDEEQHPALDDAARIEPVGQRAYGDRKQQERKPVRQHRKAGQRGRMEFLEDHPIADHVLDIVGHHGQHIGRELGPIGRGLHGRERAGSRHGGRRRLGVQEITWAGTSPARRCNAAEPALCSRRYTLAVRRSRHLHVLRRNSRPDRDRR